MFYPFMVYTVMFNVAGRPWDKVAAIKTSFPHQPVFFLVNKTDKFRMPLLLSNHTALFREDFPVAENKKSQALTLTLETPSKTSPHYAIYVEHSPYKCPCLWLL